MIDLRLERRNPFELSVERRLNVPERMLRLGKPFSNRWSVLASGRPLKSVRRLSWGSHERSVCRCRSMLSPQTTDEVEEKSPKRAEARFTRGLSHLLLIRLFQLTPTGCGQPLSATS